MMILAIKIELTEPTGKIKVAILSALTELQVPLSKYP